MGLVGNLISVDNISNKQRWSMFHLMQTYYDNVDIETFEQDLAQKDWVILIENSQGIKGFSTQMLIKQTIDNTDVKVVFSGDTIIDRNHWNSFALPVAFGRMMFSISMEDSSHSLYWFLTSKGFRTYRYLPILFKEYYPHVDKDITRFSSVLLCNLGTLLYPDCFDHKTYIIKADKKSQKLKPEVGNISSSRLKDRHISFFTNVNRGHKDGDQLACITKFEKDNITDFYLKRIMQDGFDGWEL